jgi:hypothetical protein
VNLTRTITGAVHETYTKALSASAITISRTASPFTERIQLADLGTSFNQMTATGRLIIVEREERLQSGSDRARRADAAFPHRSIQ